MRFHLKDAEVARNVADRLRGALKQRGYPRTHTKRLAAVAAMLGYANWSELLAHCPTSEFASPFDEGLDRDALAKRVQYQAEALARAAHIPRPVAEEVVAEVQPTGGAARHLGAGAQGIEDIVLEYPVPGAPEQAFAYFVHGITRWWPNSFTFSMAELDTITIEPRQGGRWYETSTTGDEFDWGIVTAWNQDRRIAMTFQLSATRTLIPRERASEVSFDFLMRGNGCAVKVAHFHLHRHGAEAPIIRTNMASEHGWPFILSSFARNYRETVDAEVLLGSRKPR